MAFCERQQKQFARLPFGSHCLREPSQSTSASVERVFNNGGYLLGHTDASKTQCIDCGKLLSLGSNKPGKHGLKCHLVLKCHKDIYRLYMRKVESCQQGPPHLQKNAKLDKVLVAHRRADLVIECMKRKKH